jgi:hypothetical protein
MGLSILYDRASVGALTGECSYVRTYFLFVLLKFDPRTGHRLLFQYEGARAYRI